MVVEGAKSTFTPVRSGVPQGSVLGPCLFLVYINDLPEGLSSPTRLFADDTALTRRIYRQTDSTDLQHDLDLLSQWEKAWAMEFHPSKCSFLPVTRSRTPPTGSYALHGHTLDQVHSTKYLGVTLQSDMSWSEHISNVCAKANRTLGFLRRNLKASPTNLKSRAYKALVRPVLEYACTVWDPYSRKQIDQLESVQRRAARFAVSDYRQKSSVSAMTAKLQWPPLEQRRKEARMSMLKKILDQDVAVSAKLEPLPPRARRGHSRQLKLIQCRTLYRQNSFFPRSIAEWNSLPQSEVESAPDVSLPT